MLIEVIESQEFEEKQSDRENHDVSSSDEALVTSTLDRLVEHYNQPIHQTLAEDPSRDVELPPVLKFLSQTIETYRLGSPHRTQTTIVGTLLLRYSDRVRPLLWTPQDHLDPSAASVLDAYERLLSHLLQECNEATCTPRTQSLPTPAFSDLLLVLAQDVTRATAQVTDPDQAVPQSILCALLKLMVLVLDLASMARPADDRTPTCLESAALCVVAATCLSFDVGETANLQDTSFESTVYDLRPFLNVASMPSMEAPLVELRVHPLPRLGLSPSAWDAGPAQRIVERLWRSPYWDTHFEWNAHHPEQASLQQRIPRILQSLSVTAMAKAVRAHFFGHDMAAGTHGELPPTLFLGKLVDPANVPRSKFDEKPFQAVPSRIPSVLNFCCHVVTQGPLHGPESLSAPAVNEGDVTMELWDCLAPVLYELLAAPNEAVNGLAAKIVVHWILTGDNVQSTTEVPIASYTKSLVATPIPSNILLALNRVVQTCREGHVLLWVGLAQGFLLRLLHRRNDDSESLQAQQHQQRMAVIQSWMALLETNRHRRSQTDLLLSILLSLIPLLHAMTLDPSQGGSLQEWQKQQQLDRLALGRPLLRALLQLSQWHDDWDDYLEGRLEEPMDHLDRRMKQHSVRIAALVALLNAIIVTYPIVCHHAGKVISSCVALACHVTREQPTPPRFKVDRALAIHVAAVTVVATACKRQTVLQELLRSGDAYQSIVVEVVEEIQAKASQFQRDCMIEDTVEPVGES